MKPAALPPTLADAGRLCLSCGICCSGVLFDDVRVTSAREVARVQSLALPLRPVRGSNDGSATMKLPQPCAALGAGNCCAIYTQRPRYCREFDCALRRKLLAGATSLQAATHVVKRALRLAARVDRLLDRLGNSAEDAALHQRFRRVQRSLATASLSAEAAACSSELSLAMHDLNALLRQEFHPDPTD